MQLPFDRETLTAASRAFYDRLVARWPEWARFASNERRVSAGQALRVDVPSPSGRPDRTLGFFMDGDEPSLELGSWHTHESLWSADGFLELVAAIVADQFVLTRDLGGAHDGHENVLDLREPDALVDALAAAWAPPRLQIETWTGRGDAIRSLEDLGRAG